MKAVAIYYTAGFAVWPFFSSNAFQAIPARVFRTGWNEQHCTSVSAEKGRFSLSLEKPLGIVLEEIEEGAAKGVYVTALIEEGSAFRSEMKNEIVGSVLTTVMDTDVSDMKFDDVMAAIVDAPSPITLQLEPMAEGEASNPYSIGEVVRLTVLEGENETVVDMKVGDNLRLSLLESGFEVYRGFKSKIGNCGGGGQCTFCAVEFVTSEGWGERSDYEDTKLKKSPHARLSCLNNIQGPAVIRLR